MSVIVINKKIVLDILFPPLRKFICNDWNYACKSDEEYDRVAEVFMQSDDFDLEMEEEV